jgi:hypothetical protein
MNVKPPDTLHGVGGAAASNLPDEATPDAARTSLCPGVMPDSSGTGIGGLRGLRAAQPVSRAYPM